MTNLSNESYIVKYTEGCHMSIYDNDSSVLFYSSLDYLQEEEIIYSKNKNFIVLKHASLFDGEIIEYINNFKDKNKVKIQMCHHIKNIETGLEYLADSEFMGTIRNIITSKSCDGDTQYKIIIEFISYKLFTNLQEVNIRRI